MQFALNNAVIADTLKDARTLCFDRKEKCKAITLEGHVVAKDGSMTGGTTAGEASKSNRFDKKELARSLARTTDRAAFSSSRIRCLSQAITGGALCSLASSLGNREKSESENENENEPRNRVC